MQKKSGYSNKSVFMLRIKGGTQRATSLCVPFFNSENLLKRPPQNQKNYEDFFDNFFLRRKNAQKKLKKYF